MNVSVSKWFAKRGRLLFEMQLQAGQQQESVVVQLLKQEWIWKNFGYWMTHFLAVNQFPLPAPSTHKYTWKHTVVQPICLAQVQNPAMKSAWESSGGPEQDIETETEREKEAASGCRAQIKFHCLFVRPFPSPSPYIPSSLQSALPFLQEPKGSKSTKAHIWGQGCVSVIVKSPHGSDEMLHFSSLTLWKVKICHNLVYKRRKKTVLPRSFRENNYIRKET